MTEHEHLQRIIAAPDDDAPRLAYASWLAAKGDPARADHIALSCRAARLEPDHADRGPLSLQVRALEEVHGERWAAPLIALMGRWRHEWVRGMIEKVALIGAEVEQIGARLFELAPIRDLTLTFVRDRPRLSESPLLERLVRLKLRWTHLDDDAVAAWAGSRRLTELRELDVSANPIGDAGIEAVARSSPLGRLQLLDLSEAMIFDDGAVALARSTALASLRDLDVGYSYAESVGGPPPRTDGIGPAGAKALAARGLRRLSLDGHPVGDEAAAAFARSPASAGLEELHLGRTLIGRDGARALAASPHLSRLRVLDLGGNLVGDDGAAALVGSATLSPRLTLRIDDAAVDPQLVARLRDRYGDVIA